MSSLRSPQAKLFFLAQPGIATWQGKRPPLLDTKTATLSVCAPQLSMLFPVLLRILLSGLPAFRSVFRFFIMELPAETGKVQRHLRLKEAGRVIPGFAGDHVAIVGEQICYASEVIDPPSINLDRLDYPRAIILLGTGPDLSSGPELCRALCGMVRRFDNRGIARLFEHPGVVATLQVFSSYSSHAAIQMIGTPEDCMHIAGIVADYGARQVNDPEKIPQEIQTFANEQPSR